MPAILAQDLDMQNICCNKALQYFKDKKTITLSYRKLVRLKLPDAQCISIGLTPQEAYSDLDKEMDVPLKILDSINYKYRCDELCPFPECLEELHASELDLIHNWKKIEDIITWIDIGMRLERVAKWYSVDLGDVRRWNDKRKKLRQRHDKYRAFQDFLAYL